ncbi:MAG: sensor histidine kinase [Bacteroidales bacterium]|nr:sensor histidine kinase [Bacteroidales bacterium]
MKKPFKALSLTQKLIIYYLLISVLSLYIIARFSFHKASTALLNRTFDQLTSLKVEKKNRLADFFVQRESDMNLLSKSKLNFSIYKAIYQTKSFTTGDTILLLNQGSSQFLNGFLEGNKYISNIVYIDTLNRVFIYDGSRFYFDKNYGQRRQEQTYPIGLSELSLTNGDKLLAITKNVFQNKILLGKIRMEFSENFLDDIMFENNVHNGLGKSGETYLVGNDYYMRSSSRFIHHSILKVKVQTVGVKEALKGISGSSIIRDYRGIWVLSSYGPLGVKGLPWVVLAEIDKSEAMVPINSLQNSIIFLNILMSLLLLGVIAVIASRLLSPLKRLQQETEKISAGEYGSIIDMDLKSEIGDLIRAFNEMSQKLKLQEEKIEFEKILKTSSLIEGQEIERSRLSRELHDGLAQQILALKLNIESVSKENMDQKLGQIRKEFNEIINEIRNISYDLMPSVLVNYGLKKALEELRKRTNAAGVIAYELSYETTVETIGKRGDLYLYRIIQETLNNSIKHSGATHFYLNLSADKDHLKVEIYDDGCLGITFDDKSEGNGLMNIRERINILGGQLQIVTRPGMEVRLNILIPL